MLVVLWEKPSIEVREEAKRLVERMYRAAGLEVPVDVVPWPEQEEYEKRGYRVEPTSMFGKIWYLIYPPESSTHHSSNPNTKRGPLGFKMGPVRRWLSGRTHSSNPNPVGVRDVDSSLEAMKEKKKREWREKGYPEGLIAEALLLAQEWAYKMSAAFAPPEFREAAIRHNLRKGLEVADAWIKTMSK